jgi:hypothetical protein
MKFTRSLPLLIAAAALAATGCGMGTFTHDPAYVPTSAEAKAFSTAGVGVLPIEDQRPPASQDPTGDHVGACILLGGLYPNSAHVEHFESANCGTLTSYDGGAQEQGDKKSPLVFLRDDLVKEFSRANVLGPARAIEPTESAPFTLKAVLKTSSVDASVHCYTPLDTTWIFWMLGLPFASYDFHLVMDLTLSGPDGKALWTRTIDAKSGGTTGWYYDTGVTGENNLIKIYGDLLSGQMAAASADLQSKLSNARPDVWRRAAEFRAAAQASAGAAEPAAAPESGGQPSGQPWWK